MARFQLWNFVPFVLVSENHGIFCWMWQPFGAWVPEVESSEFLGVASSHPMPTSCVTKADPDSGHCKEFRSSKSSYFNTPKKRFFWFYGFYLFSMSGHVCVSAPKIGSFLWRRVTSCVSLVNSVSTLRRLLAEFNAPWQPGMIHGAGRL